MPQWRRSLSNKTSNACAALTIGLGPAPQANVADLSLPEGAPACIKGGLEAPGRAGAGGGGELWKVKVIEDALQAGVGQGLPAGGPTPWLLCECHAQVPDLTSSRYDATAAPPLAVPPGYEHGAQTDQGCFSGRCTLLWDGQTSRGVLELCVTVGERCCGLTPNRACRGLACMHCCSHSSTFCRVLLYVAYCVEPIGASYDS